MNRAEHLEWAKKRAHEALDRGGKDAITDAVASMLSDLGKHEDLVQSMRIGLMVAVTIRDKASCEHWIDGFN